MSDDWRLRIELGERDHARELERRLSRLDLSHDLTTAFRDRVVVSRDDAEVFCYAETRVQAEAAERVVRALAAEGGWQITTELRRWHPDAEEWEDPDRPIVHTRRQQATEHAELLEQEREESAEQGFPGFEVRVRCPTRQEAERLSERLRGEGIDNIHRWQFVVVGVPDEDSARDLAERIRREAPAGSEVTAETSVQEIGDEAPDVLTPFNNPFAVFGGLGG
jgi:hypothetical protein